MRFIKLAIISIVVLFLLLTCLGLLLPSTVRVTRNITIHASQDTLNHYISDIKYWKLWFESAESTTVQFLSARTKGTGTVALIGGQEVDIIKATKEEVITVWKNNNGKQQTGIFQLTRDSSANTTNVNWYFEQKVAWYPWERLPTLANDKILGPIMEHSLDKLKAVAEAASR